MRGRGALVGALLCATLGSARGGDFAGHEGALFDLYYALEVASYCTLVSPPVAGGFQARARVLEAHPALDDARRDYVRGKAWQAAHAEWQNRGLGGFKAWCRNEGREAARWLAAPAP